MKVAGTQGMGGFAGLPYYVGLSTDDKPQTAPQGAMYFSADTGEQWVYNEGMWIIDFRYNCLFYQPIYTP